MPGLGVWVWVKDGNDRTKKANGAAKTVAKKSSGVLEWLDQSRWGEVTCTTVSRSPQATRHRDPCLTHSFSLPLS